MRELNRLVHFEPASVLQMTVSSNMLPTPTKAMLSNKTQFWLLQATDCRPGQTCRLVCRGQRIALLHHVLDLQLQQDFVFRDVNEVVADHLE